MPYVDIQNAVLADAFSEGKRAKAKTWINARHAWIWDLHEWTFRFGTATVTFTSGSQTVASLPSDFRHAVALYDTNGSPITPVRDRRQFFDGYNANLLNGSGVPRAYTVIGGTMLVGPAGDGSSGLMVYEKSKPTLVNDSDLTGLPDGYDLALVHGAKAEGFKLANIPLWQGFDEDFTAYIHAMEANYLNEIQGAAGQMGYWRPGQGH